MAADTSGVALARIPLSDERIRELWVEHGLDECDVEGFVRLIEREHGISTDGVAPADGGQLHE
jgi:hypothetical protein